MKAVAIDGPAGAGKSTISKRLAKELGYIYVDTGALYRAIGLFALRHGADIHDSAAVVGLLAGIEIDLRFVGLEQRVFLCGEDVSDLIRTEAVSMAASAVSALPQVRDFLMETQRGLARRNNVVMDGRDIGTVVLPDAEVKIFLTAAPEARAKRRALELEQRGQTADFDTILRDIVLRDEQDRNRPIAPLKQAEDAVLVDTTHLDLEQSLEAMLSVVKERISQ